MLSRFTSYLHLINSNNVRMPPYCPSSAYENLKTQTTQKGLARLNHHMKQCMIMYDRVAKTKKTKPFGTVYRMKKWSIFPSAEHFYVTDYKLARTVLLGDKSRGVAESVKQHSLAVFNFADRNVSNLFRLNFRLSSSRMLTYFQLVQRVMILFVPTLESLSHHHFPRRICCPHNNASTKTLTKYSPSSILPLSPGKLWT
jgi:hypothetical protein